MSKQGGRAGAFVENKGSAWVRMVKRPEAAVEIVKEPVLLGKRGALPDMSVARGWAENRGRGGAGRLFSGDWEGTESSDGRDAGEGGSDQLGPAGSIPIWAGASS